MFFELLNLYSKAHFKSTELSFIQTPELFAENVVLLKAPLSLIVIFAVKFSYFLKWMLPLVALEN